MSTRVFNGSNAPGAPVYCMDSGEKLEYVMSIDADKGEVVIAHQPLRARGDELDTYKLRFRSIYPIYGGGFRACLFHCYGQVA